MSAQGTATPQSPFAFLRPAELDTICSSSGFQILRTYLATTLPVDFCAEHAYDSSEMQLTWLLHRDILHAMIMPVVELYKEASTLAAAALCSQRPDELEVAYRGEARFAFLWLQCFITEEEDWCHTRGCPACNTLQTLATELTIRGAITAALLSGKDASVPDTPSSETESEAEDQPSLPDFTIVLGSLEQAMDNDPFWGPGYYAQTLARSKRLMAGIQELMSQCQVLESLVSSAPPSPSANGLGRGHAVDMLRPHGDTSKEMKLKKGAVARRQAKLKDEQGAMIMRMALQTWSAVHLSQRQRSRLKAAIKQDGRVGRKRTCTT
ncbi:uncharacterized protein PV09_00531 [Verruconis gallopava]|uniref:Uncharacterized protein n=1 Tax=Verruconis gallopava TaxID=253628 RepID=A0A0D1Y0J6_9PEZI|nr:uncharacterized protein PV09_00531 [Verruconis gallopava]KIW08566.1 hypothetical protein PV09_00531 [Verruconis gallopava]